MNQKGSPNIFTLIIIAIALVGAGGFSALAQNPESSSPTVPATKIESVKLKILPPFSTATLILDNKGNINYKDKTIGTIKGNSDSSKIPVEEYNKLAGLITASKLFTCDLASCKKEYEKPRDIIADSSYYVITIVVEGKEKSVSCYGELEPVSMEGYSYTYYYTYRHILTTCPEEIAEIIILIKKLWGKKILQVGV